MERTSCNDGWRVRPRTSPFAEMFSREPATWQEVTLPHDAMLDGERGPEHPHDLGYFPEGTWTYERHLDAPAEWRGRTVLLEFEGVYRGAVVSVNGTQVARRPYGYSAFSVSLGEHLRYGETNVIRVDCIAHADTRWYSGAGIHRPVHLVVADPVHIALDGVVVTTPQVDADVATVVVATAVENATNITAALTVTTELSDAAGAVVGRAVSPLTVMPGATELLRARMHVVAPRRWSVDSPTRYTCTTTLERDGEVIDTSTTTFGIRTITVDPVMGLRINGEPVTLRGACVHHDNGVIGSRAIARADERRVEIMKAAGFNALRSAHNPMSRSMIEACDRLGMLVMDESFDMWRFSKGNDDYSRSFDDWWAADLTSMVVKDRNHPSVILYSIGNEIPETGTPVGSALGRAMAEHLRALDPTRLVTNGVNPMLSCFDTILAPYLSAAPPADDSDADADDEQGDVNTMMTMFEQYLPLLLQQEVVGTQTAEAFAYLDVAGYNYAESRYAMDGELFPQRVIVGSENRPPFIAQGWKLVQELPHVIGDFTWTGWDYLGEAGIGRIAYDEPAATDAAGIMGPYPYLTAGSGDIDITGFRRPVSFWREVVYGLAAGPYLAVQPPVTHGRRPSYKSAWALSDAASAWTWTGDEGKPVTVEVYADADEVELLVNGVAVGRASAGAEHEFRAVFETVYEPGELTAVAYRNGAVIARSSLATATGPVHLQVEADRSEVRSDDTDLAYVTITLVDAAGTPWTSADRAVTVTVAGAGELLGLGSANPCTEETFGAPTHDTFRGRVLAVVRPTGAGSITVSVSAPGCTEQSVAIEAR